MNGLCIWKSNWGKNSVYAFCLVYLHAFTALLSIYFLEIEKNEATGLVTVKLF